MDTENLLPVLELVERAIASERVDEAVEAFLELHLADQAAVFNLLDEKTQSALLNNLDIPATADLFDEMTDEETLEAADGLAIGRLADVLDEMEPDEAADLLGDLPPAVATQALAEMEDPEDVLPLLGFPDETAGGRMTTAFIALRRQTTAKQAIDFLRSVGPVSDVPYYLFVVDREKRLAGVIGLRELVIADPDVRMENVMEAEVIFVTTETDQEEAARTMARYNLAALPVVDDQRRLVGVITGDDLVDVLDEEATEDIYRLSNVTDTGIEPESGIWNQIKGRLPWLYLSMLTSLFAAWVISRFEYIIAQVAVLAVFQSVVAGLGGNAVTQNMAITVRALALGRIAPKRAWPIILRQSLIGLLMGIAIGVVVGLGAFLWRGNIHLGLILGLALIGNLAVAGVAGTMIPLVLKALGQDPALASAVLVTTVTDSMGFLLFLGLASYYLGFLTA
ncbi:MAG TPA: magnesium transporter [Anaerolineales bacterium]|nr:magnesium transporter [Anaerolineales bacterium]